jgi:hypothetical protein
MTYNLQLIKDRILEVYGEPKDLDDLARCCITMAGTFDNAVQPRDGRRKRAPFVPMKIVGFAWDIVYGPVSNYHEQPINGLYYNAPGAPDHYMGWKGRVWIRYGETCNGFMSDPMRLTLTHTGTGGAGSYGGPWTHLASIAYDSRLKGMGLNIPEPEIASWDYRFFADDWPLIQHDFEKQLAWSQLTNKPSLNLNHKFTWTDPETAARDEQCLKDYEMYKFMNKDKLKNVQVF